MINFPDDIFSEPEDVDPDTLANLGPLRRLAGVWEGRKGVDLNPKAEGPERRDYLERIEMQPIDPQANGPGTEGNDWLTRMRQDGCCPEAAAARARDTAMGTKCDRISELPG